MDQQITRRNLIGQAGLVLGGAIALKALPGCGGEETQNDDTSKITPEPDASTAAPDASTVTSGSKVGEFPYDQHLPANYQLDGNAIREAAYHLYYAGGCCHGSYRALLEHLATTAGAPFNQLPLDFGKFGAGGIGGYGSICGALLGATMIINSIVADAKVRDAMMTDLLRWYEGASFPSYVPATVDTKEVNLTKDFSAGALAALQTVPHSHLCHASVSSWCAANGVSASGEDKKARCARLTADVAGKAAEMLNTYLTSRAFTAAPLDTTSATCVGCHSPKSTTQPVASGMACGSCHSDKLTAHP